MKNTILAIAGLLIHFSVLAQKEQFVGTYANSDHLDTTVRIFLSRDSVKQIRSARIKRKDDLWLEIKCGSWKIKSYDPENGYVATFFFSDGTFKEVIFLPSYATKPEEGAPPPLPQSYTLHSGREHLTKRYGNNSSSERMMREINSTN